MQPGEGGKTGGQLLFEAARQYGITHVFGNPGTTEVNFMDAVYQSPEMQFFLCLHENVATGAADGFARMTGRPALVNVHLTPGLTNAMANIHNAKRARVPMIVTVGDHHTRFGLEESALAGDILGIARAMCKWAWEVSSPEELPAALHQAMLQAMTPPRGPVCLALPNNLLSQVAKGEVPIPSLHLPQPGPAHPQAIEEALQLLKKAQKPMIVVGEVFSPAGRSAVLNLAKSLGASVWREPFPTRLDPSSDPIGLNQNARLPYLPKQRREILRTADCILLAGVSNFTGLFMYDDDPTIELAPENVPIIHIEADAGELGKNAKSALTLLGDPDLTLLEMQTRLGLEATLHEAAPTSTEKFSFRAEDDKPLTALVLGQALRTVLPPETIFVDESITAGQGIWAGLVNDNPNLSQVFTGRGGALGFGLPNAIGAHLAAPSKPVLAISGDGTAAYVIQSLWTMARYKMPIVNIICNNRNYDIITLEILRAHGKLAEAGPGKIMEYTGLTPPEINFAALAEGFGVASQRITKASELVPAIERAFASGAPALLDVSLASSLRSN
jgi:benzoylformate decarboxylase